MLARRLTTILPAMRLAEALETTRKLAVVAAPTEHPVRQDAAMRADAP